MRAFTKLLVDVAIFTGQSLDVLGELCNFLSLQLGQLGLLLDLFPMALQLGAEHFDFLLAFEKLPLVVVLLANRDAHLVLHVRELKHLLL